MNSTMSYLHNNKITMALGRIALVSIKGIIREIEKEIAGVMSISLENAVEDKLLELKAYGGTEQRNDISCAQGPSPDGFHVPSKNERVALIDTMTDLGIDTSSGNCMKTYMKLPFAGYRYYSSAGVLSQGTYAYYWSSTAYSADGAYSLRFYSAGLRPQNGNYRSYGFSVRCFKDTPVAPNSSWTTLYSGTGNAGIFHNSTLGLISVSGDGTTWTTIADKNLGATVVYNDGDALAESNCGYYYQWGNNYGFAFTGTVTTSNTQVDASSYGPGNYYSSSTFITSYDWSSVRNDNLWGGVSVAATDPTPTIPMNIVSNNGVLKFSKNMANVNSQTALFGYYISSSGVVTADANNRIYQKFIPCKPNTTYTLSMSQSIYFVSISEYSTASNSDFIIRKAGSAGGNTKLTITTGANTNYLRFGANLSSSDITIDDVLAINRQLEEGNTPTPYKPYAEGGLYVEGTTETIKVIGKNLNGGGELENKGYTSTGGTSTSATFCGTLWKIKVKEGEKYTVSYGNFPDGVSGVFVSTWKTDGTWNLRQAISIGSSYTYTIPSGIGEVNFTLYKTGGVTIANNSWLQVEKGDTATEYVPYFDGGTATAEMLLKVGDYADEQEIISGNIIRNVGILVLDGVTAGKKIGTAWNSTYKRGSFAVSDMASTASSVSDAISSHFEYSSSIYGAPTTNGFCTNNGSIFISFLGLDNITSAETANQWLADQYNAGTPVIVIYPLNTPTTESVAGQTMHIPAGNSTIEITQASMDTLELSAKYKALPN